MIRGRNPEESEEKGLWFRPIHSGNSGKKRACAILHNSERRTGGRERGEREKEAMREWSRVRVLMRDRNACEMCLECSVEWTHNKKRMEGNGSVVIASLITVEHRFPFCDAFPLIRERRNEYWCNKTLEKRIFLFHSCCALHFDFILTWIRRCVEELLLFKKQYLPSGCFAGRRPII